MRYVDASIQTIDGAHTVDDTTVDVSSASEFRAPGIIKVWDKDDPKVLKAVISFTGISTNQLTGCVWDYGGHTDVNLVDGDLVAQEISARDTPDLVFADTPDSDISVGTTSDVEIFSEDIAGVVAGDVIEVEIFATLKNGTGGNRVTTLTLDFDARFDMEWDVSSDSPNEKHIYFRGLCAVIASNKATLHLHGHYVSNAANGVMQNLLDEEAGWDVTTEDLTGTVAVTLHARSDATNTPHNLNVRSFIIRKISSVG